MKITLASQSLNYVMATFQAPNRTTIQQPSNTLVAVTTRSSAEVIIVLLLVEFMYTFVYISTILPSTFRQPTK